MTTSNPFIPPTPVTPPAPTQAQLLQAAAGRMTADGQQLLRQMVAVVQRNWNAVWANPAFTAAQFWAQVGPDGAAIMQSAATLTAAINAIAPGLLPTQYFSAAQPYTTGNDGTVTLTPAAE
jgi:hypothetical protein